MGLNEHHSPALDDRTRDDLDRCARERREPNKRRPALACRGGDATSLPRLPDEEMKSPGQCGLGFCGPTFG
jgi:hypothetical protein